MLWRLRAAGDRLSSLGLGAWVALFACAALLVRLPFLFGEHETPARDDANTYLELAHSLLTDHSFAGHRHWTPGYPAFEAALELLPGRRQDAIVVTQHLVGVVVVIVILIATWRYFGKASALVAASLAAFSPIMVIHEHTLLPDFLFGVLLLAGALTLAEAIRREPVDLRLLALTGVVFGLAAWLKPAGQFLFVAALPALLFATRSVRRTLLGSAVVALALVVTISPWLVRNAVRFEVYSMSNQGGETLFHRVFFFDGMPIPTDQKYGPFAQAVRRRVDAQLPPKNVYTYEFHYALIGERGLNEDQARAAEGRLARVAIWRHPGKYLSGTWREFKQLVGDLDRFEGAGQLLAELEATRPPVGTASTTAIWDAMRPIYDVWWLLSLSTAAGLVTLLAGGARTRNAAAALLSVWLAVMLGTSMAAGAYWRYSVQLAPITWMLASAGIVVIASSVWARVRDRRGAT